MKTVDHPGLYLFAKQKCRDLALKEMLQFLRVNAPGKSLQFAYVETSTALIPHLSLWENLHVTVGGTSWHEFVSSLDEEWKALAHLIRNPDLKSLEASAWEKLTVGLLKAALSASPNVLIDLNEDEHTEFNTQALRKILTVLSTKKTVYLATALADSWSEDCQGLISKEGYTFSLEEKAHFPLKKVQTA